MRHYSFCDDEDNALFYATDQRQGHGSLVVACLIQRHMAAGLDYMTCSNIDVEHISILQRK